jgi:Cu-Zn family superoxide dismutase
MASGHWKEFAMTKVKATLTMFALLGAMGCASGTDGGAGGTQVASSQNMPLVVYQNPYTANAMQPNPIPTPGASATATAWNVNGNLRLSLGVSGMPANRAFGAHLHKADCSLPAKAGGHYQNTPFPATSNANDPMYGNPTNEAWLDFTTGADGRATVETTVAWMPRAGEAKSIIIHDMKTDNTAKAGDKLACLPLVGF